jgi:hypothetical protein
MVRAVKGPLFPANKLKGVDGICSLRALTIPASLLAVADEVIE